MGKLAVVSVLLALLSIATYSFSWVLFAISFAGYYDLFQLADMINVGSKAVFFLFTALFLFDLLVAPRILFKRKREVTHQGIQNKKISVVMPAYNEAEGITNVVKDFLSQKGVSEVVVIDNACTDNTGALAKKAGARVVRIEPNRGFGGGCYKALQEARGDIVVLVESDSTQKGRDLKKLIPYLENVDMVVGTRTTAEFINEGATMDWFLRWGNIFISKLIQVRFYNRARLTDAGCTFRAIKKELLQKIIREDKLKVFDDTFNTYLILVALKNNMKIVEVPVSYNKRVGKSKSTGKSKLVAFKLGLLMIWRIVRT